jgi:hypothetical protein
MRGGRREVREEIEAERQRVSGIILVSRALSNKDGWRCRYTAIQ